MFYTFYRVVHMEVTGGVEVRSRRMSRCERGQARRRGEEKVEARSGRCVEERQEEVRRVMHARCR